jgi:hypothetical protein
MNTKFYSLGFLALLLAFKIHAQCVNITLSTQAQVDSFPSTYGCTSVSGTLTVMGEDITNLNGLHQLTSVSRFEITSTGVANLTGLENLQSVGSFEVNSNQSLNDLTGLSSLTTVTGFFFISANLNMQSLHGLEALRNVNTLDMRFMPNLMDFTSLNVVSQPGCDGRCDEVRRVACRTN